MEKHGDEAQALRPAHCYWPAWSLEAAKLVGPEVVQKIMEHLGGTRIYIPEFKAKIRGSALSRLIGIEAVKVLAEEYGGLDIEVPRGLIAQVTTRNRMIAEDRRSGLSTAQIALKYRLTERSIRNVYRKLWG